jgi:hypothetical protein
MFTPLVTTDPALMNTESLMAAEPVIVILESNYLAPKSARHSKSVFYITGLEAT